ncbi:MAG: hypothetical protein AAGH99_13455 [Planctomycetota bacterium]
MFEKIDYKLLNSRQKENYNFQKLSAVLADYGFITHRLTDDWNGADLIAQDIHSDRFLKIQLKGRMTFAEKYRGKDLYIAFRDQDDWYIYPHDTVLDQLLAETTLGQTDSWQSGGYSFAGMSSSRKALLKPYQLAEV